MGFFLSKPGVTKNPINSEFCFDRLKTKLDLKGMEMCPGVCPLSVDFTIFELQVEFSRCFMKRGRLVSTEG